MQQHERGVDHDAGRRHHTEDRWHRKTEDIAVTLHQQMPPDRAHEGERKRGHDDQRLLIGMQRNGQQREYGEHGQQEHRNQPIAHLPLPLGALHGVRHAGVGREQFREEPGAQLREHRAGRGFGWVHLGHHTDGPVAAGARDGGKPAAALHLRNGSKRHRSAVRSANAQGMEGLQGLALLLGEPHHDADILAPPLDTLRLLAVEGLAHLASEIGQRDAEGFSRRRNRQLQLLLAGAKRIGDLINARILRQTRADARGNRP